MSKILGSASSVGRELETGYLFLGLIELDEQYVTTMDY